jgi:hypothetical protein
MISKERRKQSWKDGGVSATRYDRACKDARKSSRDEDINLHVDFWHGTDGVDVKGWVCGEAKWIAFEMPELGGYVRVEREELLQWCLKNVDFDHYVILKQDAYRGIYQRIDRKDKITMLALHDLQELKSYTIVKYLDFYIDPKDLTRKKIELS